MATINITKNLLDAIEQFASCSMSIKEVALIVGEDEKEFIQAAADPKSEIFKAYKKGELQTKAKINAAIIKMAERGSNPAQIMAKKMMEHTTIENEK